MRRDDDFSGILDSNLAKVVLFKESICAAKRIVSSDSASRTVRFEKFYNKNRNIPIVIIVCVVTIVFWKLGLQSLYYIESRYHHYGKLCVVALSRVSWALRLCPEFGRSDLNLKEMMCDQHRGLVL